MIEQASWLAEEAALDGDSPIKRAAESNRSGSSARALVCRGAFIRYIGLRLPNHRRREGLPGHFASAAVSLVCLLGLSGGLSAAL